MTMRPMPMRSAARPNNNVGLDEPPVTGSTVGAVGATQYVQWVNTAFAVFNKSTGDIRSYGSGCNFKDEVYDYEMELASIGKFWTLWLTDSQERTTAILKIKQLFNLTTARSRDYVPTLPIPFVYGIRRHMDWLSGRCNDIDIKTEIKLESSQPPCREFVLPEDVANPSAAEAFHRQRSV